MQSHSSKDRRKGGEGEHQGIKGKEGIREMCCLENVKLNEFNLKMNWCYRLVRRKLSLNYYLELYWVVKHNLSLCFSSQFEFHM